MTKRLSKMSQNELRNELADARAVMTLATERLFLLSQRCQERIDRTPISEEWLAQRRIQARIKIQAE